MEFLVRDLRIDLMMLLLVIYLIAKTYRHRNKSLKHQYFHRLLWVGLMQVILVSAILFGDTIQQMPVKLDFSILLAYFFGLCLCTYGWFMYSEVTRESKLSQDKRFRIWLIVPLVIYFLLCVTSWWTRLLMYVDDDGLYQRGRWAFLQFLIPGVYIAVLVFRSLSRWRETRKFDAFQRGVLFFPISYAVAIVLQILYGGDYIVIATVASLVVAYIELYSIEENELNAAVQESVSKQREQHILETLYTDSLTSLRNRLHFYREIQNVLDQKQQKIYYSINMHDFKRINLLYGPKKGDSLLLTIASVLRDAFPELEVCRLSGDEFGFLVSPKEFSQHETSRLAHSLFTALHTVKVEGLEKERFNFAIGAVFISSEANFKNPDDVLTEGAIAVKMAHEHPGNFIWSEQGSFPDVEGCFMELSEDRILYNGLNDRLFSIHDESDWFNYLHDGAKLKEDMYRHNVANIDDIISYYKTKGLPDFDYENLFRLVTQYAVHIDAFMFEMLVNDILIPYFESLEPTDRERSYLGHLYMLMIDCLMSVLRMGDRTQLKRIREFMQKARDITRDFPHDSIRFEPYFYTLCEIVGHYESLQGLLCDITYIDEAYEELRELLTGKDRFVVPDQEVYNYFSDLVDNARLFPLLRACYLLINRRSLKPAEQEELQQRICYVQEHQVNGVYDLASTRPQQQRFTAFLQTLLTGNLTTCELVDRISFALHQVRTDPMYNVANSNIVAVSYLFLGASQALVYCAKSDEEKRRLGIGGMEFLLEILRKRQSYATDSQVLFLIQVLMKSMFSSPVLSPALKYHYIKQTISATTLDTYCHSKAVSSYAKLILSNIIDEHPELLVGQDRPYQTFNEVKANRENLLTFMEYACMLHDIGKINIIPVTSNAYRRLTNQEFGLIRRHPAFGISYLKEDKAFDVFHPFVYEHHRWWNGEAGYPKMEADETPSKLKILVDLLSVCDSLEAATSRIGRNYRSAKTFLQLLDEFIVDSGIRYSADIVNFIIGSQKTFYQLRLMVDKNWQKEYLSIFQEVVSRSDSDYRSISADTLPDLYAHSANEQGILAAENLRHSFDLPEWFKSMSQKEQSMFSATLFEYTRLMSQHDKSVTFFYNVDTDQVGFLHPTPGGKVETIFINHFSEKRINLVLSEEGYHKAIGIIHRIIDEPDFPKQGEEKLEYSDKSRCLIATYTSILSQGGQVLSIAGRLQDISLSTERLLQTIQQQNKFIETFDNSITGLLNRSSGESLIKQEIVKGGAQVFAILDCDNFKQINDQLSYLVGNKVLSEQGRILKEFFRDDICMHLGGDEFVAFVKGDAASQLVNSFNGLQRHFETLKNNLAGLHLPELENIPPTMSMGIVYTHGTTEPQDFESLYTQADDALKQSKKHRYGTITITELSDKQR